MPGVGVVSSLLALNVTMWTGVATVYDEPRFHGRPLFCDTWATHWHYDALTPPWVALDVGEFEAGRVACGDEVVVCAEGQCRTLLALDAGLLAGKHTYLGGPIVADIPGLHAWHRGVTHVRMMNRTRIEERMAVER